ncbi:MAG: NUDIX domain-containing protein [Candidatus Levybacteria bacterium]|nr:NUDIX domain-containing protein [Candidatus Levybacteria bacterium]
MEEARQMLILVDENDVPTGKYEDKGECHFGDGLHHRAFVVLLENAQGEVLLQKRKHVRWDGYLDVSAISHVLHFNDHDETYEEAGLRSLKTEMGISKVKLTKIGGFNYFARYFAHCENEYCAVLVGKYDGKINANQDVVYEAVWVPRHEFIADVKNNPEKYTPWALLTVKQLSKFEARNPKSETISNDRNTNI